jgi:hypothetical protein
MREEMRKMAEGKDKVYERLAERMAQTNNIKPNHAVGEVYKPQTLRVHDPDGLYAWEERVPVWVWVMRALGALGFMVGIYCLVFLGMLL